MGKTAMGWFGRLAMAAAVATACAVLMPQVAGAGERIRFSTSFGELHRFSAMTCNFTCYGDTNGPTGPVHWSAVVDFGSRALRRRGKAMMRVPQYTQIVHGTVRRCFDRPLTVHGQVISLAPGLCGQLVYLKMKLNPRQKRTYGLGDWYYMATLWPQDHGSGPWYAVYFDIVPAPANTPDSPVRKYWIKGFWNEQRFTNLPEFDATMRYMEGTCHEREIDLD